MKHYFLVFLLCCLQQTSCFHAVKFGLETNQEYAVSSLKPKFGNMQLLSSSTAEVNVITPDYLEKERLEAVVEYDAVSPPPAPVSDPLRGMTGE